MLSSHRVRQDETQASDPVSPSTLKHHQFYLDDELVVLKVPIL